MTTPAGKKVLLELGLTRPNMVRAGAACALGAWRLPCIRGSDGEYNTLKHAHERGEPCATSALGRDGACAGAQRGC
jgi:hypothetical protein